MRFYRRKYTNSISDVKENRWPSFYHWMSLIDFNLTTIWSEWGVFEVVYYNPYYKKKRPNQGGFGLVGEYVFDLKFIWVESFSWLHDNHLQPTDSSKCHLPDSFRQIDRCCFLDSICWRPMSPLLYQVCYRHLVQHILILVRWIRLLLMGWKDWGSFVINYHECPVKGQLF